MIFFPQLSTEALVQYPLRKRVVRRAVRNVMADGTCVEVADFRNAQTLWTLQYSGLTDTERRLFESFLDQISGRLRTFVFVEPAANLLRWSERLGQAPWMSDPLLQVIEGPEQLSGSVVHRVINHAQATQVLKQVVSAPAFYRYCFSFQIRADTFCTVGFRVSSGGASVNTQVIATDRWQHGVLTGTPGGDLESVQCEIEAPNGAVFEIAALQLEISAAPSPYQKTTTRGHIYPFSRLYQEHVRVRADGVDNHAVTFEIASQEVPES